MADLEFESIKRLDIQPGEILVATLPDTTSAEQLAVIAEKIKAKLPDTVKLLVVTNVEFHILSGRAAEQISDDEPMRA